MRVLRTVVELRAALLTERGASATVGLVPTMGALHAGHLSLIARAREECDVVVVSLFVNPSQFDQRSDLDRYPRDQARDRDLAEQAGADILFAPDSDQVYPPGFATSVEVLGLTDRLEGAVRGSSHFRGVTTVVTKLLNMVAPDVAYFGQKDAQQAIVIRRLVADLDLPVRIETCPTVRESDGLAMSSRNARLSTAERSRAVALFRGLSAAATLTDAGERSGETLLAGAREAMAALDVEPEYLALVDPTTLEPVERLQRAGLLAVAARIGETRLIDNLILDPTAQPTPHKLDPAIPTGAVASDKQALPANRPQTHRRPTNMQRTMLKSKIHRATVTDCDLHYVGSITIDPELLEAGDILEHEQVHVVDVDNGARFETYTIAGQRGSGEMKVNGAAARLVHRGDTIIVISYAQYSREDMEHYEPRVVHVEAQTNRIITVDDAVATLLSSNPAAIVARQG